MCDDNFWVVENTGERIHLDDIAGVSYRADPDGVATEINTILAKHNLLIELLVVGDDRYWFRIKTIAGNKLS